MDSVSTWVCMSCGYYFSTFKKFSDDNRKKRKFFCPSCKKDEFYYNVKNISFFLGYCGRHRDKLTEDEKKVCDLLYSYENGLGLPKEVHKR